MEQEKISSYSKEYHRQYYKTHKEEIQTYMKGYYQKNRERLNARNAALRQRYIETYGPAQAWIRPAREARGIGRRKLGKMLGVSRAAVYQYEIGALRAPTERIKEVLGIE